uniref:UPF0609 protein n=1 Tax=Sipha flava TaxID=143950 RepID=A0A2S2QRU7_9HEMI
MEKFFAYQKDSRLPCKYGKACFQKNKEHLDKYKHPPTKEDLRINNKKKTGKKDVKKRLRLNSSHSQLGESSNVNSRNNSFGNNHADYEMNDMEVPEQSNVPHVSETRNNISSDNMNNSQHSTDYIVPSIRQNTQEEEHRQQPQLLLTSTALDDCSGDDGIVPCTPTLFTPRRLDGETVSSPHVPSSSQVERFTFVGESQTSQVSDSNDGEQQSLVQQIVRPQNENNPTYWNKKITELFLVGNMPKEFYEFWNFCSKKCPVHPEDALLPIGFKLVGPYDVLAGRMNEYDEKDIENTVLHWRYYYDPPEFQTIIASTDSEFHIGYYRDQPFDMPIFVASNDSGKNCIIQKLSNNIFYAIRKLVQNMVSDVATEFERLLFNYEHRNIKKNLNNRKGCVVAKTFHKAGIVVPYDIKTDVGYRPLAETEKTLRTILQNYRESSESKKIEAMDKLQPIINYANIASDECDFGTGFELGIDIFCDGNPELHRICEQLLVTAYNLLKRPQFGTIIKVTITN